MQHSASPTPSTVSPRPAIAIIGFGEVGPILARAFVDQGCAVSVYDVKVEDPSTAAPIEEKVAKCGARLTGSLQQCLAGAALVFSAVTASQAEPVAKAAAPLMKAGQTFIDLNSVSPKVKQRNSVAVTAQGANYVESAVMAPVPPQGIKVPMLLGGRQAAAISDVLNALGLRTQAVSEDIGLASAIKLCRSIMIKGTEAMCVQSMLAAHHFGVDQRVLKSLAATFPGVGWDEGYEAYLIGRVAEHGQRRSEEMREAAAMLEDLGMNADLATAIADVQEALARVAKPLLNSLDEKGRLPQWRTQLSCQDIA